MAINRETLKAIRSQLQSALATIGAQHGVTFDIGMMRFETGTSMRCTLNATDNSRRTLPIMNAQLAFAGTPTSTRPFPTTLIGKSFQRKNTIYTVVALKMSRPKYPLVAQTQNGTKYRLPMNFFDGCTEITK